MTKHRAHPAKTNDTKLVEELRLQASNHRTADWKRWGPYLAERQWATVREDYSDSGNCWEYFPHDHARSRAYRWGEDGLMGFCDRQCRLCFAVALWNGQDSILKERLFGLGGPEGNHGEDVKECYYYLDSSPTHSYVRLLYKYPQQAFPYEQLVAENGRRGRDQSEFELADTGIFDDNRYFDVVTEYAKSSPNDVLIRITVFNRGPETAPLHVLPTLWFRNSWSWGCLHEGCEPKPLMELRNDTHVVTDQASLGKFHWLADAGPDGQPPQLLFTENETNSLRLFGYGDPGSFVKDAFHEYVVNGHTQAVNPNQIGTKAAAHYVTSVPPGESVQFRLRLFADSEQPDAPFDDDFDRVFEQRIADTDAFFSRRLPGNQSEEERRISRQAYAGLLTSKQFYHYVVSEWLYGDPEQPAPPEHHRHGRNQEWKHLFNRDVISMPDKWEYPWYAAWDLAFHMLPFARVDPEFARNQLILFLREWYMHPNGQIPAYEFAFSDVNPPVHAWACWRVYQMTGGSTEHNLKFLKRVFHKLLLNFTWWVNRKDPLGKNLFSGGFLGLDNIGVFDRSRPLPNGEYLEQADGTAWMAFYCLTMLSIAMELAVHDDTYEDIASKFFEHFVQIVDAMNSLGGSGLWDEQDGFYYDEMRACGTSFPLRVRSIVGIIPLFAVGVLSQEQIDRLPSFKKRMEWFLNNRPDLHRHISYCDSGGPHNLQNATPDRRLLSIPSRERLERMLAYILDENEFLSPHGIRALSRYHEKHPFIFQVDGQENQVRYEPAESRGGLFGGNSNWRGPVWFPVNYLLVEALERYHDFYGDELRVEFPTGSGHHLNLKEVANALARRLVSLFIPNEDGERPLHGSDQRYAHDPHWKDLVLFYEYFDGNTGKGLGASHQTGWTTLVAQLLEEMARRE